MTQSTRLWHGEQQATLAFNQLHAPLGRCSCEACEQTLTHLERYLGLVESTNGTPGLDVAGEILRIAAERDWYPALSEAVAVVPPRRWMEFPPHPVTASLSVGQLERHV